MKKIFSFIGAALIGIFAMTSCTPDDYGTVDPNGVPSLEGVEPIVTVDQNINQVTFSLPSNVKDCMPIWYFDGKPYSTVDGLKRIFTVAGTYTAEFRLMNRNGISEGSKEFTFTLENTIFNFDQYYRLICGGEEGGDATKEWRIDNSKAGHMGCGEPGTTGTNWWSAQPDDKAKFGVYDNRVTFGAKDTYTFDPGNSGTIYVNVGCSIFPEYNTTGEDFVVPAKFTETTFKFEPEGALLYITLPENTPFPYIPYDANWTSPRFIVESITGTELNLIADNGSIAWHFTLTSGAAGFQGFKYRGEANIWRPVDENSDYTTHFWYAPNWAEIDHPGFKQDGAAYTFTLPQATFDQWQAQCFIIPNNLRLESSKTYDFSCIISSTTDIDGVTVKIPNKDDNGPALFVERFPVKAYEDYVFYMTDVAGFDDLCKLVLDFGGNKDNCEVTVKNIVLKDHAIDDGTVLPSDDPEDGPGAVEWREGDNLLANAKMDDITYYYAPGWNQIDDPKTVVDGGAYTLTLPEATSDRWQCQFTFHNTGVQISEAKKYDYRVIISPTVEMKGVTVKLTQEDNDNVFITEGRHDLNAYEDNVIELVGLEGKDISNLKIVYDFGGAPAGDVTVKGMLLQEHKASASELTWDATAADNLWEESFLPNSFYYAPGWNQIDNPKITANGRKYIIDLPEATSDRWQAQVTTETNISTTSAENYDFQVILMSNTDIEGATVKLTQVGNDNVFYTEARHNLTAYEEKAVRFAGMSGLDIDKIKLVLDFGGCPANTQVEVRDIILRKAQ